MLDDVLIWSTGQALPEILNCCFEPLSLESSSLRPIWPRFYRRRNNNFQPLLTLRNSEEFVCCTRLDKFLLALAPKGSRNASHIRMSKSAGPAPCIRALSYGVRLRNGRGAKFGIERTIGPRLCHACSTVRLHVSGNTSRKRARRAVIHCKWLCLQFSLMSGSIFDFLTEMSCPSLPLIGWKHLIAFRWRLKRFRVLTVSRQNLFIKQQITLHVFSWLLSRQYPFTAGPHSNSRVIHCLPSFLLPFPPQSLHVTLILYVLF